MPFLTTGVAYGIGALVTAVGAGVSYYQQNKAAGLQSELASLNAQAQSQSIAQQGRASSMQALINQSLADKDKAAANANARLLERQAEMGTRITTENVRRGREDMARLMAVQRAQAAKNGFVDTSGSPLSLLVSSAEEEQRMADALRYEDEASRRALFKEAGEQRNAGILAGITGLGAAASGASGRAQAAMAQSQNRLDLYAARAGSAAMRTNATSGLLSAAGGLMTAGYQGYRQTPRGTKARAIS